LCFTALATITSNSVSQVSEFLLMQSIY